MNNFIKMLVCRTEKCNTRSFNVLFEEDEEKEVTNLSFICIKCGQEFIYIEDEDVV